MYVISSNKPETHLLTEHWFLSTKLVQTKKNKFFFSKNKTTSLFSQHINSNRLGNINVKLDNCQVARVSEIQVVFACGNWLRTYEPKMPKNRNTPIYVPLFFTRIYVSEELYQDETTKI